jgi:phospholipase/lecithinase/hemolysin
MATQWLRRALLVAAGASALVLAACGGGSVVSQFAPTRVVAFGDAMADLGQTGSRYTVNDGSVNNWTQVLAASYGLPLQASVNGGQSYATGNARVTVQPDAAGNVATPTVTQQVDAFLASSAPTSDDLVLVSAGTSDVIAEAQAVLAGFQTEAAMLANVGQAGRDLGAQVRRLVSAGATHVIVAGPYNLGRSPWVVGTGNEGLLESASTTFNSQLLVSMVDLGATVLYVDAALYFNQQSSSSTDFTNTVNYVCNSADPGPGIGTGPGQVNSRLCTPATVVTTDYNTYMFADRVYPTPLGHQLFGGYAGDRIRSRW